MIVKGLKVTAKQSTSLDVSSAATATHSQTVERKPRCADGHVFVALVRAWRAVCRCRIDGEPATGLGVWWEERGFLAGLSGEPQPVARLELKLAPASSSAS